MKFKDLFGPYAAYVKKNEPLACPKRRPPSLGGHSAIGGPGDPAGGVGGEEVAGRGRCGWLRVQGGGRSAAQTAQDPQPSCPPQSAQEEEPQEEPPLVSQHPAALTCCG